MKRTYITGEDTNSITLGVKVGTQGTAYSSVYTAHSGGLETKIADSEDATGSIRNVNIGKASKLRNSYLLISTVIDLSAFDPTTWDNLTIRYHLNGGGSGNQVYNQDIDDTKMLPNGKILVTKPIELQ
jgi:hypothetical protein